MVTRPSILQVLLYDQAIGTLAHLPGDKHLFAFDDRYIRDQNRPTLSLSFKDVIGDLITHVKITQSQLPPFFSNLLPEGAFRDYLAKQANINPLHEFSLLQALGKDLPGALTVQTLDSNDMLVQPEFKQRGSKNATLRFSLAGVQLKFSALEKANHRFVIPSSGIGGKWIVKLPHSTFRGVPENEYTMMELARKVGIDVPKIALCSMEELGDLPKEFKHLGNHFFAIERFDRTNGEKKIHIEDFAQVFGVYPEKKYKSASYRNIAEVIWREIGEEGTAEFVRRLVFNALIGNGDMHLKNWSLIYRDKKRPALAPAYDFVSTIFYLPEDQLALSFIDSRDFHSMTLEQFKRFAAKAKIPEHLVLDTAQKTVQSFAQAWKTIRDFPLSGEIRGAIEKHLKTMPLFTSASSFGR